MGVDIFGCVHLVEFSEGTKDTGERREHWVKFFLNVEITFLSRIGKNKNNQSQRHAKRRLHGEKEQFVPEN